ncbi:MAG: PhoX family phosphatase [Planctomycetota bacterium]
MFNEPKDSCRDPSSDPSAAAPRTAQRSFTDIVQAALDRRTFLLATMSGACAALLPIGARGQTTSAPAGKAPLFRFASVVASMEDAVCVPPGYVAQTLYRWGDPVNGTEPQFVHDASNSAADQAQQAGMGHDGMEYFAIPGVDPNQRGMLAINHEYNDQTLLFADGIRPYPPEKMPLEKVRKSQYSLGVSLVEVARQADGSWQVVPSPRARRVTACTAMRISGPATAKIGTRVQGTLSNCAAGRTPWGTYLTCEENFHAVFGTSLADWVPTEHQRRYTFSRLGYAYRIDGQPVSAHRWHEVDERFDLAHPDNDADRFGYVVEIDPLDPTSEPVKRTALGRIKHENAELTLSRDGRVVVYTADDEQNEYIYKFVSAGRYEVGKTEDPGRLLDEGTLYVAKFEDDGTGRWVALVPGRNGIPAKQNAEDRVGFDAADVAVRTREAADLARATPMDRPEWIAVHPETKEVFVTLTNNSSRGVARPVDAANPRARNLFGHIVRWREDGDDPAAETFRWRVFVLAGNPASANPDHRGDVRGDAFGCPDGLRFDPTGILWIQTDMSTSVLGKGDFANLGNNMMLAADPTDGEVRRFLTGPRGCEITGMTMTPDRRTLFINVQHPGEPADDTSDPTDPKKCSAWPDGPVGGRPRSATVAIRRLDGGVIGS